MAVRRLVKLATVLALVSPKAYQRILAGRARLLEAQLQRDMCVGRLIVGPRRAERADRQQQRAKNSHALNHKPQGSQSSGPTGLEGVILMHAVGKAATRHAKLRAGKYNGGRRDGIKKKSPWTLKRRRKCASST